MKIEGQIVDIVARKIFSGAITIEHDKITHVEACDTSEKQYILPGFVDAHNHIESSMLVPSEFARHALKQGTIAMIADPHEIANVCGEDGIRFMMDDADQVPMKICFAVPSCVPATPLCSSGATIDAKSVAQLLQDPRTYALAEMMNFVGIVNNDAECLAKVEAAHQLGKPVDGHIPMVSGDTLKQYIRAGISTDHESSSFDEAEEKLQNGMKIIIREGSTARNFNALHPLISQYASDLMFCSDDLKAFDLMDGHINKMVSKAVKAGYDLFDVLRIATYNPIRHYHIPMGMLQEGDPADFILCDNLEDFQPKATYINGTLASELTFKQTSTCINNFKIQAISEKDIADDISPKEQLDVIQVLDGELFTPHLVLQRKDYDKIQKIVVINRYQQELQVGIGYIKGFDLHGGAMAQTIAHDSHHIIATGSSDALIVKATNRLIGIQGGIVVTDGHKETTLSLPIAGLMSPDSTEEVARQQKALLQHLTELHCPLTSPMVALSFMALPVIPELKITECGLFDFNQFKYIS